MREMEIYERWLAYAAEDPELLAELEALRDEPESIKDAFFRDLAFGTGGLRGVLGAGTNRMNRHTVARATQGLANYLKRQGRTDLRVAIGYDSRLKSDLFARTAAEVFAASGIEVHIYPELAPTPCLSYAVRELDCQAGIMVTASHNPAEYNGYKVYGADGCQITTEAAESILQEISRVEYFQPLATGKKAEIKTIPDDLMTAYIEAVKAESLADPEAAKDIAVVYSPLHGTGLKPVTRALKEAGYTKIQLVEQQTAPDGNFPTSPEPNPEYKKTLEPGIALAREVGADLVIATDPDCDRVGIAVKHQDDYLLLSGNEIGLLLLDFVCARRTELGTLPERPLAIKTIVTTDLARKVAQSYFVEVLDVLTGFKYIGEQIGRLEAAGRAEDFIFGFEESNGYLAGTYVRDKDAVVATLLICDMFSYHRARGLTLAERLSELYRAFGYSLNTLYSYGFEGAAGFEKMQALLAGIREETPTFGPLAVMETLDYKEGRDGLPPSDVLKYVLEDRSSVVVRPSGTEPKLKVYISVNAEDPAKAAAREAELKDAVDSWVKV